MGHIPISISHEGMQTPPDSDTEGVTNCAVRNSTYKPRPIFPVDLSQLSAEAIAYEVSIGNSLVAAKYGRERGAVPASLPTAATREFTAPKAAAKLNKAPAAATIDSIQAAEALELDNALKNVKGARENKKGKQEPKKTAETVVGHMGHLHAAEVEAASALLAYRQCCEFECAFLSAASKVTKVVSPTKTDAVKSAPKPVSASPKISVPASTRSTSFCAGNTKDAATISAEMSAANLSIAAKVGADFEAQWVERSAVTAAAAAAAAAAANVAAIEPPKVVAIKIVEPPKAVKRLTSIEAMRGANWPVYFEGPWPYPTGQSVN
ncbi:hypothetical protein HDU98_000776 [Podochytrium sp. JEL0797]|nr:hypothetical protein HDU98_000776 [Podochytrium sp. JEL0797]